MKITKAEDQLRGYRLAEHMTARERAHASPSEIYRVYRGKVVEELLARGVGRAAAARLVTEYGALIGAARAVTTHPAAVAKDILLFESGQSPTEVRLRERRMRSAQKRKRSP